MVKRRDAQPPIAAAESAFIRAIARDPDEDTPRLAFADWLSEHGQQDRAEFIRAQCRLEGLPPAEPQREELLHLANRLLGENEARWSAELGLPANRLGYRRGFPETITTTPTEFARFAERVFAVAPIRSVQLRSLEQLPGGPREEGTTHTASPLPADWLKPVLARPEVEFITELDFAGTAITDHHLAAVLACPRLRPLTALNLNSTSHLLPGAVELLASSPAMDGLKALDLGGLGRGRWWGRRGWGQDGLGPREVRLLTNSRHLRGLTELNLAGNTIRNDGAVELAASGWALTVLDLGRNLIGPIGATALSASRWFGSLEVLRLGWNCIKDAGTRALARSESFPHLRVLDLRSNQIGHEGAQALLGARSFRGIRWLHLSRNTLLPWDDIFALHDTFGDRLQMSG
jgi:uncharacterized protein (TIGR02996 family)